MKVYFNSGVPSQIGVSRTAKQAATSDVPADQGATLTGATRSTLTHTVPRMVSRAMSSPEVRQDKVDAIRSALAGGTYKLDASKIAGAMLSGDGN